MDVSVSATWQQDDWNGCSLRGRCVSSPLLLDEMKLSQGWKIFRQHDPPTNKHPRSPFPPRSHMILQQLLIPLSPTPSNCCSLNTWMSPANPKDSQLVQQHNPAPYPPSPAPPDRNSPNQTPTKNEGEPTFCLLFSKVDHGPGLVRDCDRGDV